MNTPTHPAASGATPTPKKNEWPIFISYRRSDATRRVALELKKELEASTIEAAPGQIFKLIVFVDVAEAHQPDFQANLAPHLKQSRALIVLADDGSASRKTDGSVDYLYEELDWWAKRKKTPPIILQMASNAGSRLVADAKFSAWRKVSFMDCFWEKWTSDEKVGSSEKAQLLVWLRKSIREYGVINQLEEVRRLKRRLLIAILFGTAALFAASLAWRQTDKARQQTEIAQTEAKKAELRLGSSRWFLAEQARDQTQDHILAAHLFTLAAIAFENAEEPLRVKNALMAAELMKLRSAAVWALPEAGGGAVYDKAEERVLTWGGNSARLWVVREGSRPRPVHAFLHDDIVNGAAFSTDENRIVTWSADSTARVWDVTPGASTKSLQVLKHAANVTGAGFSKDGTRVLTCSEDHTACLWEISKASPAPLLVFPHKDFVVSAQFNRDESRVLTSCIGYAALWRTDTKADGPLRVFDHGVGFIHGSFSKDENRILTWAEAPGGSTVKLWEINSTSSKPLCVFPHELPLNGASFNKDESKLLTWSWDKTVKLWSLKKTVESPALETLSLSEIPAAGTADPEIAELLEILQGKIPEEKLPEPEKPEEKMPGPEIPEPVMAELETPILERVFKHESVVFGASLREDGTQILTWSNAAKLWNVKGGEQSPALTFATQSSDDSARLIMNGAKFNKGETRVLTWSRDNTAGWWSTDPADSERLQTIRHRHFVAGARLNCDESRVLTWSRDGTARLSSLEPTFKLPVRIFSHGKKALNIEAAFYANEQRIVTRSDDGTARLWAVAEDGLASVQICRHEADEYTNSAEIKGAVPNGDGRWLLTWRIFDKEVSVWSVGTNSTDPVRRLPHEGSIDGAAFSENEKWVLTWAGDTAYVWDFAAGGDKPAATLKLDKRGTPVITRSRRQVLVRMAGTGPTLRNLDRDLAPSIPDTGEWLLVTDGVLNDDETRCLTWGADGIAELWELGSGRRERLQVFSHDRTVNGGMFSRNGNHVLTWSAEGGSAWVWTASSGRQPLQVFRQEPEIGEENNYLRGASFSHDGKLVLTWGIHKSARIWEVGGSSIEPLQTLKHPHLVRGALFSEDDGRVLTWSEDNKGALWIVGNGSGKPLLTFEHDRVFKSWDDTEEETMRNSRVNGATFNKDESMVLTWGRDGSARLWRIAYGRRSRAKDSLLDLELSTATTLTEANELRSLTFEEWASKSDELGESVPPLSQSGDGGPPESAK